MNHPQNIYPSKYVRSLSPTVIETPTLNKLLYWGPLMSHAFLRTARKGAASYKTARKGTDSYQTGRKRTASYKQVARAHRWYSSHSMTVTACSPFMIAQSATVLVHARPYGDSSRKTALLGMPCPRTGGNLHLVPHALESTQT